MLDWPLSGPVSCPYNQTPYTSLTRSLGIQDSYYANCSLPQSTLVFDSEGWASLEPITLGHLKKIDEPFRVTKSNLERGPVIAVVTAEYFITGVIWVLLGGKSYWRSLLHGCPTVSLAQAVLLSVIIVSVERRNREWAGFHFYSFNVYQANTRHWYGCWKHTNHVWDRYPDFKGLIRRCTQPASRAFEASKGNLKYKCHLG